MTSSKAFPRIGRYEIECLAGEGASARVYRARDSQIGRTVAIKVLKKQAGVDQEYLDRFQREAQSAGTLSHPNIVTIYDVGRVDDAPYITMEFLDEKSLEDLLASNAKLPLKRVLNIALQLARALDYAHRRGVIHRDVKPGNILLIGETVKLTDFGIARLEGGEDLQRTQAGTMLGTPRYMSPEQISGYDFDGRSDLFSLGAVLYELLTARKAFDSDNVARLMLQIMQQNPLPIATIAPDVPVGMQRIVTKLLSKRPEQRYATGAQLVEALERELEANNAQEEEVGRNKFMPLRIKLAVLSGGTLAFLFLLCMSAVYDVEARIIRDQLFDAGTSLAKFVAVHSAVPVLDQDWVPLRLFVQDARARNSVDYLVVTDHGDLVQASTEPDSIGKPYRPPHRKDQLVANPDVTVSSVSLRDGRNIFLFDTPILFQKTEVGHIFLGIDQAGVTHVLDATLWLMAVLGLFATITVGSLSYLFARFIARPLRALRRALQDLGDGDLDRRISETRNDEFGALFQTFNAAAEGLQACFPKPGKSAVAENRTSTPPRVVLPIAQEVTPEATLVIEGGRR
jgi:serine/threonine-protein kinase